MLPLPALSADWIPKMKLSFENVRVIEVSVVKVCFCHAGASVSRHQTLYPAVDGLLLFVQCRVEPY